MTIHHATVKNAAKSGIILTEIDTADGPLPQAHWAEVNFRIQHPDPKAAVAAVRLEQVFRTDWPNLTIDYDDGHFVVVSKDEEPVEVVRSKEVPDLADALEASVHFDVDPEMGLEEAMARAQVVPQRYREEYTARGNPNHCGDWLAGFLDGRFLTGEGKLDVDAFTQLLIANGVEMTGKWASLPETGSRGWQGRYRMNGRQKLEVRIAMTGVIHLPGAETVTPPLEVLEDLLDRHPSVEPGWSMD